MEEVNKPIITSIKTCQHCGKDFPRPMHKGNPLCKREWMARKYCSRACSSRSRLSYLSTDAKKTRTVRGRCNQAGPHQVERVRNLHGGDEAQAQPQVKTLGSLGRVKGPILHAQRDRMFERYLHAVDQYLHFTSISIGQPIAHQHAMSLYRHIQDLNSQLQRYDERINAAQTTGPLLY